MSVNMHRVLEGIDGEFGDRHGGHSPVAVDADVEPGREIRLRLETDGPGAASRTIVARLSRSEARLLGGRLVDASEQ